MNIHLILVADTLSFQSSIKMEKASITDELIWKLSSKSDDPAKQVYCFFLQFMIADETKLRDTDHL